MGPWNIVTTTPRREFAVMSGLSEWGVTAYLPVMRFRMRAAPTTGKPFRDEYRAMFSGYVFAQLGSGRGWTATHAIPGLVGYLRGHDGPKSISEAAIAAVRQIEEELLAEAEAAGKVWKPGDRVEISGDEWSVWKDKLFSVESVDKSSRATLLLMAEQNWPVRVTVPVTKLKEAV